MLYVKNMVFLDGAIARPDGHVVSRNKNHTVP